MATRHLESNLSASLPSLSSCFLHVVKGRDFGTYFLRSNANFCSLTAARHGRRRHWHVSTEKRGIRCFCLATASSSSAASSVTVSGVQLRQDVAQLGSQPQRAYPFHEIEPKWQHFWERNQTFRTPDDIDTSKPKFYVLDMFPYPSGAGLHVGHPEGYTATDIVARYKRMQGFNVLHPMGWDAFGLPAEQYAIETGTHPRETTKTNINRFRTQLKSLGFSYDWEREISTTEPNYYKWTQWIFVQLFKRGLAYQAEVPVNWCPALGTVLANEEVIDGVSERGGHPVIRKPMRQWMLKITEYADRLLKDLDELDWPESIKDMQRNWIGKSEGAEIDFQIKSNDEGPPVTLRVFTTRPDTLCGATYLVIAPEHPLLQRLIAPSQKEEARLYIETAARKSDLERTELQKDKTGIFSGTCAINPATKEEIPIWIADYVLGSYGTGAIMAVPAHDTRDFEFAQKFGLPIRMVITPQDDKSWQGNGAFTGDGMLTNSSYEESGLDLNGLASSKAIIEVVAWLEKEGYGRKQVNYKLRDWLFARQRYWGEPFPVIFLDDIGEAKTVDESELPIKLPEVDDFSPSGTGDPPLAKAIDWVIGVVSTKEPFHCLVNQGMILGEVEYTIYKDLAGNYVSFDEAEKDSNLVPQRIAESEVQKLGDTFVLKSNPSIRVASRAHKMSKSRGNVINPDDVVNEYGADSLRLYEMFMGPLRSACRGLFLLLALKCKTI
ncbi:hypothetical protein KP509_03G067300 [Ceratopteris richardii]|uniref:leucine--tRNA ligase n=1 Tax=Ceratopteris richardii TaxID=49495 RepID=A0A8T2V893_CERRI|nr:hypothetical protein KP509_03G067300 [Ceratopteris richardii]